MIHRLSWLLAIVWVLGTSGGAVLAQPTSGDDSVLDVAAFSVRRDVPRAKGLVTVRLDAAALAHSRGQGGRFADVRVIDAAGRQVPYLLERLETPLSIDLTLEPAQPRSPALRDEGQRRRSVYAVRLPYENLPSVALTFETSARVFSRFVRAGVEREPDRQHRDIWFNELATDSWRHTDPAQPVPVLTLSLGTVRESALTVVVDEGDNEPLPITRVRLLLPAYQLRFYHPEGPVQVVYGREDLRAPKYDLALRRESVLAEEATQIALGEEQAGTAERATDSVISPRVFWGGLSLAAIILAAFIVYLMRGSGSKGSKGFQ